MKKSLLLFCFFVVIIISINSFTLFIQKDKPYKISINGVNRDFMHDGLKLSEFAEMKIDSKDENSKIETIEITLARGARAISMEKVAGNTFDLNKYKGLARAGDRIVIDIKLRNKPESSEHSNWVVAVPIF